MKNLNCSFIEKSEPLLSRLTAFSEQLFPSNPNTSLLKFPQFCKAIAQQIAARSWRQSSVNERQIEGEDELIAIEDTFKDGVTPEDYTRLDRALLF